MWMAGVCSMSAQGGGGCGYSLDFDCHLRLVCGLVLRLMFVQCGVG